MGGVSAFDEPVHLTIFENTEKLGAADAITQHAQDGLNVDGDIVARFRVKLTGAVFTGRKIESLAQGGGDEDWSGTDKRYKTEQVSRQGDDPFWVNDRVADVGSPGLDLERVSICAHGHTLLQIEPKMPAGVILHDSLNQGKILAEVGINFGLGGNDVIAVVHLPALSKQI